MSSAESKKQPKQGQTNKEKKCNINKMSLGNCGPFKTPSKSAVSYCKLSLHPFLNVRPRYSTSAVLDISEKSEILGENEGVDSKPRRSLWVASSYHDIEENDISDSPTVSLWHSKSAVEPRSTPENDIFHGPMEQTKNDSANNKKKTVWNWKLWQYIPHMNQQRFHCIFSLQVHAIDGFPESMNGFSVSVSWRRKDSEQRTSPGLVENGRVEFEEILHHKCHMCCSKNAKERMQYSSKISTLVVSAGISESLVLGKYHLDLSSFLAHIPKSDLCSDDEEAGSLTTSFQLQGQGKGGIMTVTFGFRIPRSELLQPNQRIRKHGSAHYANSKFIILPRVYGLLAKENDAATDTAPASLKEYLSFHACVDAGGGKSGMDLQQCKKTKKTTLASLFDATAFLPSDHVDMVGSPKNGKMADHTTSSNTNDEILESGSWKNMNIVEDMDDDIEFTVVEKGVEIICPADPDSLLCNEINPDFDGKHVLDTLSQDEDLIVAEFLSTLEQDSAQDFSSQDCGFQHDGQICGSSPQTNSSFKAKSESFSDLAWLVQAGELELQKMRSKVRARILEDAETEALLQRWESPEENCGFLHADAMIGFGSPISIKPTNFMKKKTPSAIPMTNGGILKIVNPHLLVNAKSKGKLIIQSSRPLVVHSTAGSNVMAILQRLASLGAEKLAKQAKSMMPLEDIRGKSFKQLQQDAESEITASDSRHEACSDKLVGSDNHDLSDETVSLEDIVPTAIEKIEALAVEGLKIQTDMMEHDEPASTNTLQCRENCLLHGENNTLCLPHGRNSYGKDLKAMTVALDEWMQSCSNKITSTSCTDLSQSQVVPTRLSNDGNLNFKQPSVTIVTRVQLHDAVANYEAVGGPMIALICAEQPSPLSDCSIQSKNARHDKTTPFDVTHVHIAGLKLQESCNSRTHWSIPKEIESGTRWLIANGMGKIQNNVSIKGKQFHAAHSKVNHGETLWSLSSGLGIHCPVRNPNIILPIHQ